MLNFFQSQINIDVVLNDGQLTVVNCGRTICKGAIDACIAKLRQEINNLPDGKTVTIYVTAPSPGIADDKSIVTNKLHQMASSAHSNVVIHQGMDYLG